MEKCKKPSVLRIIYNFIKAVFRHIRNGRKGVEIEEYVGRLDVCNKCECRSGKRCMVCYCLLDIKAGWAEQICPLGKWE